MDLFTYLLKKKGRNSSVVGDLFSYLLANEGNGSYVNYKGETINVDNSVKARMKNWNLGGNTSQDGTPTPTTPQDIHVVKGENNILENIGKNLFECIASNINLNGLTPIVNIDGSLSCSGTITQTWSNLTEMVDIFLPAGTYTFSLSKIYPFRCVLRAFKNRIQEGAETNYTNIEIASGNTSKTITLTENVYHLRFYITGVTANTEVDQNFKIQLEAGSTATEFEKYKGKNYKVSLSSRNLFNINDCLRGYSYNYGTTGNTPTRTESTSRITLAPENAILVKPSTKYTFNLNNENFDFAIGELQSDKKTNQDSGWQNGSITITTKSNTRYIVFNFRKKNDTQYSQITDEQWQDFLSSKAQLELGEQSTPYIQYLNIELCKIGDYQDKIYKSNDKWYLHKEIMKRIFNGSETYTIGNALENTTDFRINNSIGAIATGYDSTNFYNDRFIRYAGATTDIECSWLNGGGFIRFRVNNTIASTIEEFKEWAKNNNIAAYYIMATPTDTEITNEVLLQQLNELARAKSYNGQTNITQISEDLLFDLSVDIKTQ